MYIIIVTEVMILALSKAGFGGLSKAMLEFFLFLDVQLKELDKINK